MCGIIGGIGEVEFDFNSMISELSHRGPDSNGLYQERNLFLGHTRLSIQDLSSNGNQPMFDEQNRYVIVFNGEIYNHLLIRKDLESEYNFKSTGDTETVLYAYIKYGVNCLNLFNGIFAFAIFDTETKNLFLARDHFGVKPLYYYKDENRFLFSSEIKSLLVNGISKELLPAAFANYLSFLWSPGEVTPFRKFKKLLPGHYFLINLNNFKTTKPTRYFKLDIKTSFLVESESKLIDILEQKLICAVERQLLSDVPVGFFLSGGLDSSLLVAIATKIHPEKRFQCFTIDTDSTSDMAEGFASDLFYAKKVAHLLDVDLKIVKADIDVVKDFDKMIWHLDEPQADAAPLNVMNIAALARKNGIKVLIGGTGGDDIFSGYRRHQALRYEKIFGVIPNVFGKFIKRTIKVIPSKISFIRRLKKIIENIDQPKIHRMAGYFSWLPENRMINLFSKEWKLKLIDYSQTSYFKQLSLDLPVNTDNLNTILYWELYTFLVDHNLNYTDKMAMAVGVEARVPYLDKELVEFAQLIPPNLKMKGKETKYILKKVAERYLPKEIIYRPKTGFGAPVRKWIIEDLDFMIKDRLSPEKIDKRGIFNSKEVWRLIDDNKSGKIDASYSIWALLAIESWLIQFVDQQKISKYN